MVIRRIERLRTLRTLQIIIRKKSQFGNHGKYYSKKKKSPNLPPIDKFFKFLEAGISSLQSQIPNSINILEKSSRSDEINDFNKLS